MGNSTTPRKNTTTPSTLDTFVLPTPSPTSSSTKFKRPSVSTSSSTASKKSKPTPSKKPVAKRKKRKPLVQDNRNLGTLELLDTTDEDELPVVVTAKEVKGKGKGKIQFEEEDWMKEDSNDDVNSTAPPCERIPITAEPDKPIPRASTSKEPIPAREADESRPTLNDNPSVKPPETIELSSDDEADADECEEPPTKPSLLQRGLLAPISRLFSRQPATSSSTASGKSVAPSPATASTSSKPLTSALPNAFTALMQGHAESTQWREADQAAVQKGRLPKGTDRKVPFYKWIDGMEITVDAFRYGKIEGCKGYFLSHAHSDHYQNLSSSWQHGPIYCSLTTANLIKLKLKVEDKWVIPLPLNETVKVQGIDVTLIDANHCPGSVLFLFEGPHTDPKSPYSKTPSRIFRHLHCGDFRASPAHILHPSMSFPHPPPATIAPLLPKSLRGRTPKKIDSVYLDTTYLSPTYCFPAQELVISACADLVRERVVEGNEEALWRADGRDGERMGIKGWLKGEDSTMSRTVKDEEGCKCEDQLEELDQQLPEEQNDDAQEGESMSLEQQEKGNREQDEEDEEDEDEEGWKMVREAESESQTPRRQGTVEGYFETGDLLEGEADGAEGSLEPVPKCPEEQAEDDIAFMMDDTVKPEQLVKAEQDVDDETKPKFEVSEEDDCKPKVEGDLVDVKDEKPDVKPKNERLLVMIGTYSIGKERIVKAIAHALSTKIYADPRKKELFIAQDDPDLHSLLTDDPLEAQVHVGWLQSIQRDAMLEYLAKYKAPRCPGGFTKMIGLRPTGWTYRSESKDKFPSIPKILQLEQSRKFSPAGLYPQRDSTALCMAFGVPYSEHSSFFELTCFCLSLDYVRIIPTVNVHTVNSRNKMKEWIDRWAAEKKRRQDARMPKVVPFRNENYW
ncbi:DNA cross-link repair protein [Sporobolomyces koalae]|uniref:DNA cross-link repair protein n=1 Tax=Sporobolomyces koalae TaxID=500713 RepID=UPI00316B5D51